MPQITLSPDYLLTIFLDLPKDWSVDKHTCRCGGSYQHRSWRNHIYTKRHFNYVKNQLASS